ncbi:MAG: hypothetical protein O2968_19685 [Acidobacteria bacterium]|nr:hypothetical protein [Acidobacteriota bacterium]
MIPQIANGQLEGGQIFFTIFEVMSLVGVPATVEIRFWDPDGNVMPLPLAGGGDPVKGISSVGLQGTFDPRGGGVQITIATGAPVQIGYATVQSTPPNSVAVIAIFNNRGARRAALSGIHPAGHPSS